MTADGPGPQEQDAATASARLRVAHEALLTHWPRAARLIDEDQANLSRLKPVEEGEENWRGNARRPDLLIPSGFPLDEAAALQSAFGDDLDPRLSAYIAASLAAEGERQAAEALRVARERRWQILTRRFGIAAAIVAVVAIGAAGIAAWQWWEARISAAAAQAALSDKQLEITRRLTKEAGFRLRQDDPAGALPLAIEAAKNELTAVQLGAPSISAGALLQSLGTIRELVRIERQSALLSWPFALQSGALFYVGTRSGTPSSNKTWFLRKIGLPSRELVATIPLPEAEDYLFLTPIEGRNLVAIASPDTVLIANTSDASVTSLLDSVEVLAMEVLPGSANLLVLTDRSLILLDPIEKKEVKQIALQEVPNSSPEPFLTVTRDASRAYVVIDGRLFEVDIGTGQSRMVFDGLQPETDELEAIGSGADTRIVQFAHGLLVIDPATGGSEAFELRAPSLSVALDPDGLLTVFDVVDRIVGVQSLNEWGLGNGFGPSADDREFTLRFSTPEEPVACRMEREAALIACVYRKGDQEGLLVTSVSEGNFTTRIETVVECCPPGDVPKSYEPFRVVTDGSDLLVTTLDGTRTVTVHLPAVVTAWAWSADGPTLFAGICGGSVVAISAEGTLLWHSDESTIRDDVPVVSKDAGCPLKKGSVARVEVSPDGGRLAVGRTETEGLSVLNARSGVAEAFILGADRTHPQIIKFAENHRIAVGWADIWIDQVAMKITTYVIPSDLKDLIEEAEGQLKSLGAWGE